MSIITYSQWRKLSKRDKCLISQSRKSVLSFSDFLAEHQDKKNPIGQSTTVVLHPTGYLYVDYGTGSHHNVYDMEENPLYTYDNIGYPSGSLIVILSKTQGGKTTYAVQSGIGALEPWINRSLQRRMIEENIPPKERVSFSEGEVFLEVCDTEKTADANYFKKLTSFSNKLLKRHLVITPITTDKDLMRCIQNHAQYKVETMTPEYGPMLDIFGQPIKEYPLTVMVIDSMSQIILEDCDDVSSTKKGGLLDIYESAARGSAGAQRARVLSQLNSQIINYANKYNILVLSINHINKAPSMMGVPTRSNRMLRMNEAVSGGERPLYLAANVLRMDAIKNIGGTSSTAVNLGDDITGHISIFSWIKSKSNSKRNTCQMAYTNVNGYDRILSVLWHEKEMGLLAKRGNFYALDDFPDARFSMRLDSIYETFSDRPELISALYDQVRRHGEKLLDNPANARKWEKKFFEQVRDEIHEDYEAKSLTKDEAMDMDDIFAAMMNAA